MPTVHRIVDAMNVIGSRPDGWWRDRDGAVVRLIGQVDRWAEGAQERVTVMLEREPRASLSAERIEVAWASAPGRDAADCEILARLPDWLAEDEVTVITSDRDLRTKAMALGAEVTSSRGFRTLVESDGSD